MMDSGLLRSMKSILANKFEKLCISLTFIIRIVVSTVDLSVIINKKLLSRT
jgi:hypothetical protein